MRKWMTLATVLLFTLCSCSKPVDSGKHHKYAADYTGYFDIQSAIFTAFAHSQEEFDLAAEAVGEQIESDGKLFDIYNSYDGLNNLKTVNDNAGLVPVPVDVAILDLLEFSLQAYELTGGAVNIAMGPVLRIWHDYRTQGVSDADAAQLPPMGQLRQAVEKTDISNVIIDRQDGTVFLKESGMSLDVGAIAKGYTAQRAIEAAKKAGLESAILNMGGNVVSYGKPMDGREHWEIGIQDPVLKNGIRGILDTVYANDMALVSSGDYQRYYTVGGVRYHHIIDPQTLMPAVRFTHVTVLHPDSGLADALSTALFILPQQEGRELLSQNGAEGLWVNSDGSIEMTDGYAAVSKKYGKD